MIHQEIFNAIFLDIIHLITFDIEVIDCSIKNIPVRTFSAKIWFIWVSIIIHFSLSCRS